MVSKLISQCRFTKTRVKVAMPRCPMSSNTKAFRKKTTSNRGWTSWVHPEIGGEHPSYLRMDAMLKILCWVYHMPDVTICDDVKNYFFPNASQWTQSLEKSKQAYTIWSFFPSHRWQNITTQIRLCFFKCWSTHPPRPMDQWDIPRWFSPHAIDFSWFLHHFPNIFPPRSIILPWFILGICPWSRLTATSGPLWNVLATWLTNDTGNCVKCWELWWE